MTPQETALPEIELTERQRRERAYHTQFAETHRDRIEAPVPTDIIDPGPRRPWNGLWTAYDALMSASLKGQRVMIPGCGFGDDAIRLATLGAEVSGSDLSPDLVEIARHRAARLGLANLHFDVCPVERTTYPDASFDLVFFNDILHHVDIPATVAEARRVLQPGGRLVINELYTHNAAQRIRQSRFVAGPLYRRLVRFVYGSSAPYITEDERKIDQHEFDFLRTQLQGGGSCTWFQLITGRVLPGYWHRMAALDWRLLNAVPGLGRVLAGRFTLVGTLSG